MMLLALVLAAAIGQATPEPSTTPTPTPAPSSTPSAPPAIPAQSPAPAEPPPATPTPAALGVNPSTVAINPGQQARIAVVGQSPLSATLDRQLVRVDVDQPAGFVTVTASGQTGSDTLHLVDAAGARADIPIRVAFNAGSAPDSASLTVTGTPADANWLSAQVTSLVRGLTQSQPGALPAFGDVTPAPTPLSPGETATLSVPVTIPGGDTYLNVAKAVVVTVRNQSAPPFTPSLLFYDDDPERLTATGVLFRGSVNNTAPVRLYYYHDSDSSQHRLVILLQSQSSAPAQVQVVSSNAGPNIDVMSVGHAVSRNYLVVKPSNEGLILDLPSDGPYTLLDTLLQDRQGVAGVVDLRVLEGGPVSVTLLSAPTDATPAAITSLAAQPPMPSDGHHRSGVYALSSYGALAATYTVGGADASVQYGERGPEPAPTATPSGRDAGDYGVLQTITFTLSNPTDQPATAFLYERPQGGIVRSSFLVDGSLVDVGCVRLPQAYQISTYTLAPGQTYRVTVQTMTDGGSNYPLEVGVTGTPPNPVAPAISAPDGCFPKPSPV
jgi:hypothetical protein